MTVLKSSTYCYYCGETGPLPGEDPCPKCGRKPQDLNVGVLAEEDVKTYEGVLKKLNIAPEYMAVQWSREAFWRNNNFRRNLALERFVEDLGLIHDHYAQGKLFPSSTMVVAPKTFSKVTWASSCMSFAIKHGFTVAPLLTTLEVNRLIQLSCGHNLDYKILGVGYEEYMTADVVFVTVSKTDARRHASSIITELLSTRGARGLATHIISEFDSDVIAQWDSVKEFNKLFLPMDNYNKFKFPWKITYTE